MWMMEMAEKQAAATLATLACYLFTKRRKNGELV